MMDSGITNFLKAVNKAEVKHNNGYHQIKGDRYEDVKDLKTYVWFNGLKDREYQKHEKQLKKLYDRFCTELESQMASLSSKQEKLSFLVRLDSQLKESQSLILTRNSLLLHANLICDDFDSVDEEWGAEQEVKKSVSRYLEITNRFIANAINYTSRLIEVTLASAETISKSSPKIKTTLSVAQLGALFRLLLEDNLIDPHHKVDIGKFISENFESKKASKIKVKSASNKTVDPLGSSLKFWEDRLPHLINIAGILKKK